jgi:hypothetical protein
MPDAAKFVVADSVRVKSGVTDPDYPDIPLGGWRGTVAFYGPDDKTTTKIVAGVILAADAEPIVKRWPVVDFDADLELQQEMQDFFRDHGVKSVTIDSGNTGCPHEEGEDFPAGGDCPFCPWWKGKQGGGATPAASPGGPGRGQSS